MTCETTPKNGPTFGATVNVAARLTQMAQRMPDAVAVAEPLDHDAQGKRRYRQVTFREIDRDSDRIARGLRALGVTPGMRLALLVPAGIDFISLTLGMLKAGAVIVLIDPGMGRKNMVRCLSEANPDGFIAIPLAHAVRTLLRRTFPKAKLNVTVGRRWFWGGVTLDQLRGGPWTRNEMVATGADDPAAIIFTTGSTGPPKGVLYQHRTFDGQVTEIRDFFGIEPGEVDVPAFPMFGLFNCAMGVTAVIPDMDPTRPAQVDPANIVEAIVDWNATQAFASPAVWNRVGRYCEERGIRLATVRRVLSSGAPIPADVLRRMKECIHPDGDVHTPYGATEALPVASNAASVVLTETAERTRQGAGVCVGHHFPGIRWKVIRIVDGPIASLDQIEELPLGEIGELIVHGPVVTQEYVTRIAANRLGKIADGDTKWHRMGDVGYLDGAGRFWVCGRMAHRVLTADGPMFTLQCEAIFNQHPDIYRSALVGVGPSPQARPVMILEPMPGRMPQGEEAVERLLIAIRKLGQTCPLTKRIDTFLLHSAFPVDIRHNAKIFREDLSVWAKSKLC